jgi:hypothetical protein
MLAGRLMAEGNYGHAPAGTIGALQHPTTDVVAAVDHRDIRQRNL